MMVSNKYFLYARKSSESEDRQMSSIEDQIQEMEKLAKSLGLEIVDIISESKSAKAPGRQQFNTMLDRIYKGEANGIICWKLNRLARNPVDGGQISWLLQQGIIQHIQTYGRDYKPSDNVLMMQVELGMANQFIRDLRGDVSRGTYRKAMRGWSPASTLPIGYKHNKNDRRPESNKEIIPDPERFDIVKKLWAMMITGKYSIPELKEKGDLFGLRARNGKYLSLQAYYYIFSNEFYCGFFTWKDDSGNPVRIFGKHKIMISEDEFNYVQILLGERGRKTRNMSYDFPYRILITCSCGSCISPDRKLQIICTNCKLKFSIKNRTDCPDCGTDISKMKKPSIIDKTYYKCNRKRDKTCKQKSIEIADLENQILSTMNKVSIPEDFYIWSLDALEYIHRNEIDSQKRISEKIHTREKELISMSDNYIRMRAREEISATQLARFQSEIEDELKNIRKQQKEHHNRIIHWIERANDYLIFAKAAPISFQNGSPKDKTEILSSLGSNLTLKDKKLFISLPKPLLGIKSTYDAIKVEKDWFEPKKALENKGSFSDSRVPIQVGCTGLYVVRTYIINELEDFVLPECIERLKKALEKERKNRAKNLGNDFEPPYQQAA